MTIPLPDDAKALLDAPTFVVLTTLAKDGAPHSTTMWIKRDGDDVLFSTVRGRQKARNLERDPRASVTGYDPANPYSYFSVSGEVTMTPEGGRELIDELSMKYGGQKYPEEPAGTVRLVCRLTPRKILGK
jgi:PPOX class probable F420-dependent enzyme